MTEDLISFIGRRIDSRRKNRIQKKLEKLEAKYHGLNQEEAENIKVAHEKEAVYLTGFMDGVRYKELVR